MTTELTMLAWTLALALVHILAFDIARTNQYGINWNTGPRDEAMPPLNKYAERLQRAQNNLFETLPLFIAAVLALKLVGLETPRTALGTQLYFWARVAYLPLYAFGVRWLRSVVWLVGFAGLLMLIFALLGL